MRLDEDSANQTTVGGYSVSPGSFSSCVNNMTFSHQHTAKRAISGISWKKCDIYGDLLVDKHVLRLQSSSSDS